MIARPGQALVSPVCLQCWTVGELEELNVIMEVIFLQLDKMDVLIMSYRLSSASCKPGYQKVVMMLRCAAMLTLLAVLKPWLCCCLCLGGVSLWVRTVNQPQPGAALDQTLTGEFSDC